MRFHERIYDVTVLLGDPSAAPPWHWAIWQQVAAALDPLFAAARGPGAVRTTQYRGEGGETIRFGRLGWNAASHQRWTHGSPATGEVSTGWCFVDAELWAPAWTACEREDRAPDVFLSIGSECMSRAYRTAPAFEPVVLLAVAEDLGCADAQGRAVEAMRALTAARLVARSRRPWGLSSGSGFTNALQDLVSTGLFAPGDPHARPVELGTLAGEWAAP